MVFLRQYKHRLKIKYMILVVILLVLAFVGGFLVGRNNPSLPAINKLIAAGKAVVDKTGAIVKAVKS